MATAVKIKIPHQKPLSKCKIATIVKIQIFRQTATEIQNGPHCQISCSNTQIRQPAIPFAQNNEGGAHKEKDLKPAICIF
jgi:hypothetical protein